LRAQVNPHFLFNALNSLRALIDENPARARDAVSRLASILRYSLSTDSDATVPFGIELDFVMDYLELELLRVEDRLTVTKRIHNPKRSNDLFLRCFCKLWLKTR
jgi:two-component system, LytTR family, sensor kinase